MKNLPQTQSQGKREPLVKPDTNTKNNPPKNIHDWVVIVSAAWPIVLQLKRATKVASLDWVSD